MAAAATASTASTAVTPAGNEHAAPVWVDIGANLTDPMFQGVYHGKQKHDADYDAVLGRAWDAGVKRIVITAGNLEESRNALALATKDWRLGCTVGVHPTRAGEFEDRSMASSPEAYTDLLRAVIAEGKDSVLAIGECGLDADRTHFCPFEVQIRHFDRHFALAEETGLSMFLHSRNCGKIFNDIVRKNRDRFRHGVVHSFTGTAEEAKELVDLGLHIGINGCSLKTAENIEVLRSIPLEWLMLETDAPWCGIKRTHSGYASVKTEFPTVKRPDKQVHGSCVKDRCEPCHIVQVAEVVAAAMEVPLEELSAVTTANTDRVFHCSAVDTSGS